MNTKKLISILCAAALILSLAACGSTTAESEVEQALTDGTASVDGSVPPDKPGDGTQPAPEKPDGDNAPVTVESGCTWTLTGNCTLTDLLNKGTINFNGYTITLADGTVLR